MIELRPYQHQLIEGLKSSWANGHQNVMLVSPTGSGKTVVMSKIPSIVSGPGVAIAHRTELVSQISIAMARVGVEHNIIAASSTVAFCISQHIAELGRKFFNPRARVTVAAIDTLNARAKKLSQWAADQKWWVIDESHHVLAENKWGKGIGLFKARGVGFTATPIRADRRSLHMAQGGVFTDMIVGPSMRNLIDQGSLCDYRIFVPPQSINLQDVKISSTGDFSQPSLRDAAHKSRIVGDVVEQYLRIARGLRGITFTVDVEQANELAKAFNDAGVPAMAISATTPDSIRASAVKKLRDGKLLQLVNVDLFGEGFDVPAVEVVSMARPTMSYGLYVQQFGRALRTLPGKTHGLVIDHVGNVKRHNLPDAPRQWSLMLEERAGKRSSDDDIKPIPVTSCTVCFAAYTAHLPACPFCGSKPVPIGRKKPEQVEGDLIELDPATLAAMRGAVERVDGDPLVPFGASRIVEMSVKKNHRERKEAQTALRSVMELWSGIYHQDGETDSMIQRRFWHTFGIDMMSAQALGKPDAESLKQRIERTWS